jgi:membrane associated rhomboid family serine protease
MFPLNDSEPDRYGGLPFMTLALICVNIGVLCFEFVVMQDGSDNFDRFLHLYGSIPQLIVTQQGGGALSSLTSIFLHGGLWHLIGNMSALWVFGRRLEDACGHWRFLCFYLACGICADILSTLVRASSTIPSIGASGAVFGLMGAYLLLFPGGRIRTLVFLWVVPTFPKIRAGWIILYYLVFQLIPALNVLTKEANYDVNYWAHLGGFFGGLFIFFFLRPEVFSRYLNNARV